METGHLIAANDFCSSHQIEISFISSLKEFGLIEIKEGSDLINKTYRVANIPQRTNLVVIGFYSSQSELQVNPKADNLIQLGDRLLVFGNDSQIENLRKIAQNA